MDNSRCPALAPSQNSRLPLLVSGGREFRRRVRHSSRMRRPRHSTIAAAGCGNTPTSGSTFACFRSLFFLQPIPPQPTSSAIRSRALGMFGPARSTSPHQLGRHLLVSTSRFTRGFLEAEGMCGLREPRCLALPRPSSTQSRWTHRSAIEAGRWRSLRMVFWSRTFLSLIFSSHHSKVGTLE